MRSADAAVLLFDILPILNVLAGLLMLPFLPLAWIACGTVYVNLERGFGSLLNRDYRPTSGSKHLWYKSRLLLAGQLLIQR